MIINKIKATTALMALVCAGVASAATIDLTTPPYAGAYYTYGNTNSYSLPILAQLYDSLNGGGTGPGNPYYINSTPGAIKDLLVIYTGSGGQDVTTNAAGFDDAYGTPNGSQPEYASTFGTSSTNTAVNAVAPDPKAGIANNYSYSWDANIGALETFLDGGTPVFFFNNNDTNEDQNLAIWAKLWITDGSGGLYGQYLYLSNEGAVYGQGGIPGGDATLYNPGNIDPLAPQADGTTDYVLSGGNVCTNALMQVQACDGSQTYLFNHNLGANQVAYAGVLPLLNGYLNTLFGAGGDLSGYTMHVELSLGCDPASQLGTCDNFKIDNGFEQLFLGSTNSIFINVPEPNSMALAALALIGLGFVRRRKAKALAQ